MLPKWLQRGPALTTVSEWYTEDPDALDCSHMGTPRHIGTSTKNIKDPPGPIVLSKRLRSDASSESDIDRT